MCTVVFLPTKNLSNIPNFKGAVVLRRNRTNFCQASKLSDFTICRRKSDCFCQSSKLVLLFSVYTFNAIDTCGYQIFWSFTGKRVRDYQIQNLVGTEFVNIFECFIATPVHGGTTTIRKVFIWSSKSYWFCIKNLKIKTNRDSLALVFPSFESVIWNHFSWNLRTSNRDEIKLWDTTTKV